MHLQLKNLMLLFFLLPCFWQGYYVPFFRFYSIPFMFSFHLVHQHCIVGIHPGTQYPEPFPEHSLLIPPLIFQDLK